MTALASLSLTDWALIAGFSWMILACAGAFPIGRVLAHRGTTTADRDDWLPCDEPPSSPAPFWTDEVPADRLLDDDPELHRRYFAIVDAERVWFL